MRIGLTGGGRSVDKVVEQVEQADEVRVKLQAAGVESALVRVQK